MGRRSINTTKSGKYMNPTDQARKEARKKELKKNKRQRQMVRAAVLKNKDPAQILEEMEKIDEMEYNVLQPSPLNEKVLRDKRKKLKETFDRVMRLYHNDEPEHWADLKRKEVEYEKKRLKKQQYYESVKHAQSVQIDEIPLPSATPQAPSTTATTTPTVSFSISTRLPPPPSALSLPAFAPGAPPGLVRRTNDPSLLKPTEPAQAEASKKKEPPSVPPGPPPDLSAMSDLDTDAEDAPVVLKEYNPKTKKSSKKALPKPNTLQQRMLAISGQNIDEFMKEMESVHKKKVKERAAALRGEPASGHAHDSDSDADDKEQGDRHRRRLKSTKSRHSDDGAGSQSDSESGSDEDDSASDGSRSESDRKRKRRNSDERKDRREGPPSGKSSTYPVTGTQAAAHSSSSSASAHNLPPMPMPPIAAAPPPHMSVPAPPMPPVGIAPPPPMMFRPPPLRPPGGPMPGYGIRMPPGPPPGPRMSGMPPPRMGIRMPPGPPPGMPPRMQQMNKAHPHQQQQQQQQLQAKDTGKGVTTITAKPQIRNLSADVTRFVPSALRVKREEPRKPNRAKLAQDPSAPGGHTKSDATKGATKDDAYMQFMNEMQGLL